MLIGLDTVHIINQLLVICLCVAMQQLNHKPDVIAIFYESECIVMAQACRELLWL